MPPNDCPEYKRLTGEWYGLQQSINQQNFHNRLVFAQKIKEAKQSAQRLEEKAGEAHRGCRLINRLARFCKR